MKLFKAFAVTMLVLFITVSTAAAAGQYIASALRAPFHVLTCKWAKKIDPANAVYYNTRDQAIADGHRPCKVCRP